MLVDPGPASRGGDGGMSARSLRGEAFNLPNAITMVRMAMIPVILWFTYYESRRASFIAAMLFAVTGATDFLDGWVARQRGLVTVIGKFLDPLADKLVVMAALVMLVHLGRVAAWVVIVVMAREFIVSGLRTIAMSEGIVIAAGQEGKTKTIFQLIGITFLLLHYAYPIDFGFGGGRVRRQQGRHRAALPVGGLLGLVGLGLLLRLPEGGLPARPMGLDTPGGPPL